MPGGDEIRDVQRAAWAGLSAGWEKWDPVIMDQLGPVSAAIIECLHIASDQQHLDVAAVIDLRLSGVGDERRTGRSADGIRFDGDGNRR